MYDLCVGSIQELLLNKEYARKAFHIRLLQNYKNQESNYKLLANSNY